MSEQPAYQVLARKFRPETFADLVGQEPMVRTLKNAFAADRIAQAFIMTGIRGTGKTTTARIIAKGLNCIGPDGEGGPTTQPCGQCEHCVAISEGRHVDVLEMDAASRTGVGDIREIIESVHYRAASARYKIYIIDEVHMLSTSAFNALLKTLEEPPAHVKFIFATTEIRKVPVTVLSRCQRFDLRRIEPEDMIALLRRIADAENAPITDEALALITRAAEGSARDATSLLDQAISHGGGTQSAETGAEQVRAMLGLADRGRVLDLFGMILRGEAAAALTELQNQYAGGADPLAVLRDLAEITHWLSIIKITPESLDDPTISPDERARGAQISAETPMRVLTRLWQMLLKAIEEVSVAPNAMMAAEMALIRLTHVADLPDPEALIKRIQAAQSAGEMTAPSRTTGATTGASASLQAPVSNSQAVSFSQPQVVSRGHTGQGGQARALDMSTSPQVGLAIDYPDFETVVATVRRRRDIRLLTDMERGIRLISYRPGVITFEPSANIDTSALIDRMRNQLQEWTGASWGFVVENSGGAPTIEEARRAADEAAREIAAKDPLIAAAIAKFPGARIAAIHQPPPPPEEADTEAQSVADVEEWDPFEEDD